MLLRHNNCSSSSNVDEGGVGQNAGREEVEVMVSNTNRIVIIINLLRHIKEDCSFQHREARTTNSSTKAVVAGEVVIAGVAVKAIISISIIINEDEVVEVLNTGIKRLHNISSRMLSAELPLHRQKPPALRHLMQRGRESWTCCSKSRESVCEGWNQNNELFFTYG